MIPIYEPDLRDEDIQTACRALESTWISSLGEYKEKAADRLAELLGIRHALLVNNGTSATHLLAHAIKFRCPSIKNILVPDNAYIAAWNAFLYGPVYRLIPVPTDLATWNVDVEQLIEEARRHDPEDTAILIVHNLGNPVNVPAIQREIPEHLIVEDNCEGLLGSYGGLMLSGDVSTGTECLASSVSFYGNKNVTCGEGGAVLTSDNALYEYLYMLHTQGQSEQRFLHHELGYNYRMTNIQAALLYSQLDRLHDIHTAKTEVFRKLRSGLMGLNKGMFQRTVSHCFHSCWMFGLRIFGNPGYEQAGAFFRDRGVDTRPMFYPMSCHEHLRCYARQESEENAALLNKECIILPSSPKLTDEQIDRVTQTVFEYTATL